MYIYKTTTVLKNYSTDPGAKQKKETGILVTNKNKGVIWIVAPCSPPPISSPNNNDGRNYKGLLRFGCVSNTTLSVFVGHLINNPESGIIIVIVIVIVIIIIIPKPLFITTI